MLSPKNLILYGVLFLTPLTSGLQAQNPFWLNPTGPVVSDITALHVRPSGEIFIGSSQMIYSSADTGQSWVDRNNALFPGKMITFISETKNGTLFAGLSLGGMFRSTNGGQSWTLATTHLSSSYYSFNCMLSDTERSLYAGGYEGLYRTTNDGADWNTVAVGTTLYYPAFHAIEMNSKKMLFASCDEGLYRSTNGGASWGKIHAGLPDTVVNKIVVLKNDNLIVSTNKGRLFISRNDGSLWEELNLTLSGGAKFIYTFPHRDELFLYHGSERRLYSSRDNGFTWSVLCDAPFVSPVSAMRSLPSGKLLIGLSGNGLHILSSSLTNFQACGAAGLTLSKAYSIAASPNGYLFAGTEKDGIFRSVDHGNSWQQVSALYSGMLHAMKSDTNGVIFAGSNINYGIIRSTDNGATWTNSTNGLLSPYINSIAITSNNNIFAGSVTYGVYKSVDKGITWNQVYDHFTSTSVYALVANSKDVVYAGADNGLYALPSGSTTWQGVSAPFKVNQQALACNSLDHIFIGRTTNAVARSTDKGATWNTSTVTTAGFAAGVNRIIVASNNTLYVSDEGGGVFQSTDNGATWSALNSGLLSQILYCVELSADGYLLAGGWTGIARSAVPVDPLFTLSDSALTIQKTKINDTSLVSFAIRNVSRTTPLRLHMTHSDAYFSTLPSDTLMIIPRSTQTIAVSFIPKSVGAFTDTMIIDRLGLKTALRISATASLTGVATQQEADVPSAFSLGQNYPNPFNPKTVIGYQLAVNSAVTLKIFDVLGREVAKLVNERQSPGVHTADFSGDALSSGIYFYQLRAGTFVETRKMILQK